MPSKAFSQQSHHSNEQAAKKPLTVWQLFKIQGPVHRYRKSRVPSLEERNHFPGILAFVYRNRYAIASQMMRRFPKHLKSDRTARRHLAEMESLGLLGVVETNHLGATWPKVYFVTRHGLTSLRRALNKRGQAWSESVYDRRRSTGPSVHHICHELCTTDFMLLAWEATQIREDLRILAFERRSLSSHEAFEISVAGRQTRLQPDGLFLYQQGKGQMCCFIEIDMCSMTVRQMKAKFWRYHNWAQSTKGIEYLMKLYESHGAIRPVANFRILVVVGGRTKDNEERRRAGLLRLVSQLPPLIRGRFWFATASDIQDEQLKRTLLLDAIWMRINNVLSPDSSLPRVTTIRHQLFQ